MTPRYRSDAAFFRGVKMSAQDRAERDAERAPSGWWLLPAIIAGDGIWAALIWWAPAAAGALAVVCGAVVLWGM